MEHYGVRLARGEFQKATAETAALMAMLMGRESAKEGVVRGWAAEHMLGFLRSSILDLNIVHIDGDNSNSDAADISTGVSIAASSFEAWRNNPRQKKIRRGIKRALAMHHASRDPSQESLRGDNLKQNLRGCDEISLDVVLACIDGAKSLNQGRTGATSIIAGGPPGSFASNQFKNNHQWPAYLPGIKFSDRYLIVSIGRKVLKYMKEDLNKWERELNRYVVADNKIPIDLFAQNFWLFKHLVPLLNESQDNPVIGMTMEASNFLRWKPRLEGRYLKHTLDGSAVVAGMAPLSGQMSAGIAVSRGAQAIQIAVAARALGGRIYAIPLREECKKGSLKDVYVPAGAVVRRETDFVPGDNALLSVSSVTELCILDRVRFSNTRVVVDNTTLSLASRGIAETVHDFDLKRSIFYRPDGTRAPAQSVISDFEKRVGGHKDAPERPARRAKVISVHLPTRSSIDAPAQTKI